MIQITFTRNLIGLEDLLTGVGTVEQQRGASADNLTTVTRINAQNFPYDANISLGTRLQQLEDLANSLSVVDENGDFLTGFLNTSDNNLDLAGRLWRKTPVATPTIAEIWYGSVRILKYNKTTGELVLPDNLNYIAADASLRAELLNYINQQDTTLQSQISDAINALGTASGFNVGTGPNNVVQLNGDGKLPAIDASLLTNIPDSVKIGTVVYTAANTPDTGYLECNGAAVSRATYSALFTRIGTTFGAGDGTTTFNIPEIRGEFIRTWDNGRGVDSGRTFGSFQADEFKSHNHSSTQVSVQTGDSNGGIGARFVSNQPTTTGSSGGAETRPRNVALLAQIKAL